MVLVPLFCLIIQILLRIAEMIQFEYDSSLKLGSKLEITFAPNKNHSNVKFFFSLCTRHSTRHFLWQKNTGWPKQSHFHSSTSQELWKSSWLMGELTKSKQLILKKTHEGNHGEKIQSLRLLVPFDLVRFYKFGPLNADSKSDMLTGWVYQDIVWYMRYYICSVHMYDIFWCTYICTSSWL